MPDGNSVELATGYISLAISTKGLGKQVADEFGGVERTAQQSGTRAGQKFGTSFGSSTKKLVGGALALVGAAKVADFIGDSVKAASDLNETVSKSTTIFGKNQAAIDQWASKSATSLGLSKAAAEDAAASLGDMFAQIGFTGKASADASKQVVQMAADLGSFNNLGTDDVLERINGAFRGEYDALQKVIPNISAARVQQEAMAETGVKNADALTAQQKAQAVLTIIQKDGNRAMGDFARTSGGLANQQKILTAQTEDLKAAVGAQLVPVLTKSVTALNGFFQGMKDGTGAGGEFAATVKDVAGFVKNDLAPPVFAIGKFLGGTFVGSATAAKVAIGLFVAGLVVKKIAAAADAVSRVADSFSKVDGKAGAAIGKVGRFSGAVGKAAGVLGGPWGIAIGLGITAITSFATKQGEAAKEAKAFADSLEYQQGVITDSSRQLLVQELATKGVLDAAEKAGIGQVSFVEAIIKGGDARKNLIDQLSEIEIRNRELVSTYKGDILAEQARADAAQDTTDALKNYGGALDKASASSKLVEQVNKGLTTSQNKVKDATKGVVHATQDQINAFTILRDGALGIAEADDAYAASLNGVAAAVKENGKALRGNTAGAIANRDVIRDQVRALNDDVTAHFKATEKSKGLAAATKDATARTKAGEAAIRKAAKAAGLNADEVQKLINKYVKVPTAKSTKITQPGMGKSLSDTKALLDRYNSFHDKDINLGLHLSSNYKEVKKKFDLTFPQSRAAGGPVQNLSGKGRQSYDTEPAMLRVDEHVWTPEEVDAVGGHGAMYRMRRDAKRGLFRGYDKGGAVLRAGVRFTGGAGIPDPREWGAQAGAFMASVAGSALQSRITAAFKSAASAASSAASKLGSHGSGTSLGHGLFRPTRRGGVVQGIHDGYTGFPALDVGVGVGTPVYAGAAGRVARSWDIRGFEPRIAHQNGFRSYGRVIQISHGAFSTLYAHLSKRGVSTGQHVSGGQLIGLSGNTGHSYGAHLHFGARGRSPYSFYSDGGRVGGGYAHGTTHATPGWHPVGENGPELVRFKGGEQVRTRQAEPRAGDTFNAYGITDMAALAAEWRKQRRRDEALQPV